ncbi:hypothetical protein L6164_009656 [Bauhinia variegata]|uniref:Uncharacterized protein n=1 Tax=Bauhinia variegata TaxID=167791 RepID=A0ACB9PKE4_BAUVA|nr:hypothetical protein L6164_009656 [Bauhinia variegata]
MSRAVSNIRWSMESSSDDEYVILVCTDPDSTETDTCKEEDILVSTRDILSWDVPTILRFHTIKVEAHRNTCIEQSSYFRCLLSGSFSESCSDSIFINCNVRALIYILKYIYGCPLDITSDNFLLLYEGALYFGVERLLMECKTWLSEVSSSKGVQSTQIKMDDLIQIWIHLKLASVFILDLCTGHLARKFMWAIHTDSFRKIPYDMLLSSVNHPDLTVDSEMHLSDALLIWLESNGENVASMIKVEDNCNAILKLIRLGLLPLWFAAGKRKTPFFRELSEESLDLIFRQLNFPPMVSQDILEHDDLHHLRIRLTDYSEKVNLSGCPQITSAILLLSLTPSSNLIDSTLRKISRQFLLYPERPRRYNAFQQCLSQTLSYEAVKEVDISKCRNLHIRDAIECFSKSFPSLRILKAAYLLNIRTTNFLLLLHKKCPLVCEIDLTVDITPLIPALVSVVSSNPAIKPLISGETSDIRYKAVDMLSFHEFGIGPPLSNITKLTLEGRTDVCDLSLQYISKSCVSLCHLNLRGCISVTDIGISNLICTCKKLNSIVVCDTSFGINSVQALSSTIFDRGKHLSLYSQEKLLNSLASNLQTLHVGGCKGISESSILELMSQTQLLKSLSLRDTDLVDHALYNFSGSSLEMLDVSNTKISGAALAHVICQNPSLKCLKARGCGNLVQENNNYTDKREYFHELFAELGKMCRLEGIDFGWNFSSFSLKALEPAVTSLKTISVGLGGMLGEDALIRLPTICPLVEIVILNFQVISDIIVMNMATSLRNLQVLALCYCFGDISISSLKSSMKNLRKLRLKRVTPWMTNDDLVILTQNCGNLVELSLLGCPFLNSDSQQIISHGWPGLVSIQLEDCGEVTANGVTSLLDCKAVEDLLLRHNGPGLQKNFIFDVASKLPLLRKLSLDMCDASEDDFDIPDYADRHFLSTVKIARCKSQRSAFDSILGAGSRRCVHEESLVLVWNSKDLIRTVVKERL